MPRQLTGNRGPAAITTRRLEAQSRPAPSRAADRAIDAFVRYVDKDNYYRFSMDAALGYRRLVRKQAGVVTSLWEDAIPYQPGREYVLTLDCVGDRLGGYLDGVLLFSVTDPALVVGAIGLYAWDNPGAVFREFLSLRWPGCRITRLPASQ